MGIDTIGRAGIHSDSDQFSTDQKNEIAMGIAAKLDTSVYAKPEFMAIQMRQIRLAMTEGLDVSSFADPKYDWLQMEEIRIGVKEGLDISKYANPNIDYYKMRQIRNCLEEGINIDAYIYKRADVIREIRLANKSKVNIYPYIARGFDAGQLEQIRLASEHGVDIEPFLNIEYRGVSLEEIRIGLEKGINVLLYAKLCYNWRQMRELRLGLEANIDVSEFTNPLFSYRQMREIRKGIQAGLPVETYAKLRFSATDMQEKRKKLSEDLEKAENNLDPAMVSVQDALSEAEKEQATFKIVISKDDMEAHLVSSSSDARFSENDILKEIWTAGVRKGILRKEIKKYADGTYKEKSVLVACGQVPRPGKDGWYEYFFRTDVSRAPKVLEDGSLDYQNIDWFDTVKQEDKLAVYHPAEEGIDGYNIKGEVFPAIKGKEQKVLSGEGFLYNPENKTYYSKIDGWIELDGDYLKISSMMDVEEVNRALGNITYDGTVHVKGNVASAVKIVATGDIIVDGFVEEAYLECDGNVMLKKGMNGGSKGYIKAGKNVEGKFLESVRVYAGGGVKVDYCLNSDIEAEGKIEMTKYSGAIVGGRITSGMGIEAQNVGNETGKRTYLKVGVSKKANTKSIEIKQKIRKLGEEIKLIQNNRAELEKKFTAAQLSTMDRYMKSEDVLFGLEQQLTELNQQKDEAEKVLEEARRGKVVINRKVFTGVDVELNGRHWTAKEINNIVVYTTAEGLIDIYRNH